MTTIKAPGAGDKAMLRRILGRVHSCAPDSEIETMIRERFANAALKGAMPARGEQTIKAWVTVALEIHRKDQRLFTAVATGNF